MTSLANAYLDRTPVLYIAGGAPLGGAEKNVLQSGFDQVAMARPITKWAHRVTVPSDIPRLLAQAIRTATSPPTGPVFLEIPLDVLLGQVDGDTVTVPNTVMLDAPSAPVGRKVDEAMALLRDAVSPAVVAGVEVYRSGAWPELREFAAATGLPVFTEYEALGTLPCNHPLWMGTLFQMARLPPALKPDVVLALGVRFGWNAPGFNEAFEGRIIHVECDPVEIGRLKPPAVAIVADTGETLRSLGARAKGVASPDRSRWVSELRDAMQSIRHEAVAAKAQHAEDRPHPFAAAEVLCEAAKDAILVADGAFTKHWLEDAVRRQNPGTYLTHGALGTMGIGLGMAIGAKAARPDQAVVCVTGDGSAGFTIAELDTMVRHDLPIVVVVMNNHSWGASDPVQHAQRSNRPAGIRLGEARYDEIAKGFGGRGQHVTRLEELGAAIEAAFKSGLPTCINFEVGMGGRPPATRAMTIR